ncbi:hypothetical protein H9Q69_005703 [Fusarium xylarioides]|nr:hypothetical protein H9Q69_005703 [Fusarium xylarioides]
MDAMYYDQYRVSKTKLHAKDRKKPRQPSENAEGVIMMADFKHDHHKYLGSAQNSKIHSLKDLIEFNKAHPDLEMPSMSGPVAMTSWPGSYGTATMEALPAIFSSVNLPATLAPANEPSTSAPATSTACIPIPRNKGKDTDQRVRARHPPGYDNQGLLTDAEESNISPEDYEKNISHLRKVKRRRRRSKAPQSFQPEHQYTE